MTRVARCLPIVLLLAAGGAARAGAESPAERVKALVAKAKVHYDLGEFQQAASDYIDAYRIKPVPALLYNIAQCYRKAGQHERAKQFYERYLPEIQDGTSRAVIENTIQEINDLLAKEKGAKERAPDGVTVELNEGAQRPGKDHSPTPSRLVPAGTPSTGAGPVARGPSAAPPRAAVPVVPIEKAPAQPDGARPSAVARHEPAEAGRAASGRDHTFAWVAAGASAVAFAAGGAFGVRALSSRSADDARTANVLYGVGGGLALTSGALFYFEF